MSSYPNTVAKHRRLTILRFLADSQDYSSNASILADVCNSLGVPSTHDQILGELSWLRENALVDLDDHSGFVVASATTRGLEIAAGRGRHEGVQRPRPGS